MVDFKIAISGGKGGIGKSMLASSLSLLFNEQHDTVAVDCDVDAPNLSIWLNEVEDWEKIEEISVSERPIIEGTEGADQCVEQCRFNALEIKNGKLQLNPFLCEGCGACKYFCPAVKKMKAVQSGWIKTKQTEHGFPLIIGQLKVGETGSGKIVTEIKKQADTLGTRVQVIDSAPGTGCPVNAALQDVDFVVLVTESTKSGFADLKKVKRVVDHFNLSYGVVINKWDVNEELFREIVSWSGDNYLGKIDYEQKVIELASMFQPVMDSNLEIKVQIRNIFDNIRNRLKNY